MTKTQLEGCKAVKSQIIIDKVFNNTLKAFY